MLNKNFKKAALMAAIAATIGASSVANASIIDKPVFKILGAVVVWGGNADASAFEVNDFIVNSGGSSLDLISGDVQPVITGQLTSFPSGSSQLELDGTPIDTDGNGVLDLDDSLAAFSPTSVLNSESTQQSSSFYVASNTAFEIKATAVAAVATDLEKITRTMSVVSAGAASAGLNFGSQSQIPHDGTGGISGDGDLSALTDTVVYTATRKTASGPGSIADQSVQFTNLYELVENEGLSADTGEVSATITYTVAMP